MRRSLLLPAVTTALLSAAPFAQADEPAKGDHPGDPAKGREIAATVCAACHNADGNSTQGVNPKLAGQHARYLYKQMKDFKAADGKQPLRVNAVMNGMIAPYTDEQLRDLAAWFSSQIQQGGQAHDRDTLEAGQKLYRAGNQAKGLPACAGCHGPTGSGIPAQFPRIGGQFAEYIETQLKAFRDETRSNDPNKMMRMVAIKMTDKEIKAVSDYIAGLR
jgi:cytochrome c553